MNVCRREKWVAYLICCSKKGATLQKYSLSPPPLPADLLIHLR